MRRFAYILAFLIESLAAQDVDFRLYIIDPCTEKITIDSVFYLTDSANKSYFSYDIDFDNYKFTTDSIVPLPIPGVYYLHIMDNGFEYLDDSIKINIPDTSRFDILVNGFQIQERLKTNHSIGFYNCEGLLNGYHEDYYTNNKIRLKGNFKDGLPIDSVVYFHNNGNVKSRQVYTKGKIVTEKYDSLSNRIFKGRYKRTSGYHNGFSFRSFYSDGKLKKKETRKDQSPIIKVKEYYPNGQKRLIKTKNKHLEYYVNGLTKVHCTRKRINRFEFLFIGRYYEYGVKRLEYNDKGELILEAYYEHWGGEHDFQDCDIKNSDWIKYLKEYENGIMILELNDCKTDECYEHTTANNGYSSLAG